ncbi:outer membrane beta-barrel family protein [Flavobacteriales bacterium]|nr:outer membrane beta-barrel family protein [Flavobacteriales bacterium]
MKTIKTLNYNIIIILFISFFNLNTQAQNMSIFGNIIDTLNDTPKKNAVVMLVRLSDSVMIDFKRTDDNGGFYFNVPIDTVEIIISHHKNDDKFIFFFPSNDRLSLNLNNTILPEQSEMMNEVTIYAYKDPVFFRGDTLVFLADSFKTKENAVVEDLLKKLPGIEVDKNGSITSQGREVNKVLVDGDEFFGTDPTIATKNLGAKSIESVEIYEEENTDSDETADETIQVMDLRLKEDAKKGYFGRISGGSDFNDFYEGELLFNRFNKDFKLSVFSLASNTPRANFGYGDIKKYGLSTDNGNFFSDDNRNWWGGSGGYNNNGIPKTLKSGIFYSDKIGEKVKIGFNYTNNQSSLTAKSDRNLQYLLRDTSFTVEERNTSVQESQDHLLNARIEIQLDTATTLEILPSYSISNSSNNDTLKNSFFGDNDTNANSKSIVNQDHDSKSYNFKTEIRLKREFQKKDRLLKYALVYSEFENDETQRNYTENEYYFNTAINDTIDQKQKFVSASTNYKSQLLFREPLSKKWSIDLEHLYKINMGNQERNTFNKSLFSEDYNIQDEQYSNSFNNIKSTNRAGFFSVYRYKRDRLKIGGYVRNVQLRSFDEFNNPLTDSLNFWDLLPQINYRHKFSNSQRIRFNYKTNSRQPSLNQLQPVQNNSNPNKIVEGNPDLRPDYSHQLNVSYNHWKGLTGSYIWSNLTYRRVMNPFSNEISYDNFGRTISKTINMDSTANEFTSFYIGGKIPLGNSPLGIRISNSSNYNITNSVIGSLKNVTTTLSQANEISFEWDTDSTYIEIGGELSYSKPTNSLNINSQPFVTQNFFLDLEIELPWKMTLFTESEYTINTQRSEDYNINFFIINFSIEKRFNKNENLILSLEGNDILNQNIIAQRLIQNNVIIDNKTTIISRYFLARLTYRFNNNKTKIQDESFH